ncbi:hypothetical protein BC567DRAFT_232698 [Phyllosticta citribraziliensis]
MRQALLTISSPKSSFASVRPTPRPTRHPALLDRLRSVRTTTRVALDMQPIRARR